MVPKLSDRAMATIAADIRSGVDPNALKAKYQLEDSEFKTLVKELSRAGYLTKSETERLLSEPIPPKAEEQWTCPACGIGQDRAYDECPVCGIVVATYTGPAVPRRELNETGRHMSGAPETHAQDADAAELAEQLDRLKRHVHLFRGIAVALVILLALIGMLSYHHFVWRYAVLDDVSIVQDETDRAVVYFSGSVIRGGLVRRGWEDAVGEEIVAEGTRYQLQWGWYVPPEKEVITVYLRWRKGIRPKSMTKTFSLSAPK